MAAFTLHDLEDRLKERAAASADVSYTRKLLDRGVAHCAKKLGEEAVETVIAAVEEDRDRLIAESADLLYHLLVVLRARGITLAEVEATLAERTGKSGLDEKASRKGAGHQDGAAHRTRPRPTQLLRAEWAALRADTPMTLKSTRRRAALAQTGSTPGGRGSTCRCRGCSGLCGGRRLFRGAGFSAPRPRCTSV